jgi:hypothetical protein
VWEPVVKKDVDSGAVHAGMLSYISKPEDRMWANGGVVARVVSGESSLSLQQRVVDAGFVNIEVIPMGSDRVLLRCSNGEDIWKVFNDAIHFFGMLFSEVHQWSKEDTYERGAWLRIYGTPPQAWNEAFFNLCVSGCGRFIRSDDCTVDRARLDFARVLISTSFLEVINSSADVVIDGTNHVIKIVEEWGCNLGEDAFLVEEERDSTSEALNEKEHVVEKEDNGNMDDLVNDLNVAWRNDTDGHEEKLFDVETKLLNASEAGSVKQVQNSVAFNKQPVLENMNLVKDRDTHLGPGYVAASSVQQGQANASLSKASGKSKKKLKAAVSLKHTAGFIKKK